MTFSQFEHYPLQVEFLGCQYGLLKFTIRLGRQTFTTNFSNVFDPITSFRAWLEAIAVGVEQCSFFYDPEGSEVRFSFRRNNWDVDEFCISYAYGEGESFLKEHVQRRQLVEAFYRGFLAYAESPLFDRESWRQDCIGEPGATSLLAIRSSIIDAYLVPSD